MRGLLDELPEEYNLTGQVVQEGRAHASGGYSEVYMGRSERHDGALVAIKRIRNVSHKDPEKVNHRQSPSPIVLSNVSD